MQTITVHQDYLDAFHALAAEEPEPLGGVFTKITDDCREALTLQFGSKSLCFTANPEDDTIGVRFQDGSPVDLATWIRIDAEEPWSALLGTTFGWGWITINQQGYCDGVLLSFDGISPTLLLSVAASSIEVCRVAPVTQRDSTR